MSISTSIRTAVVLLFVATVLFLPTSNRTTAAAGPSEQVVFSGVGFADTGDWQSPVGFWIWCQPEGTGPYGQDHACAGAMYVYAQAITVGIHGHITENGDDTYTMNVASNKAGVLSATLHNLSADLVNGPANDVEFTVTTKAGTASGTSNTAVVNVTGP